VTDAPGHPSSWTLEQLAEGELPHRERTLAEAHLRSCASCSARLELSRAVIAALEALPQLAPSSGFADAVMARVRLAPAATPVAVPVPEPVPARTRWLPVTVRGWMGLTAVLAAVMAPLALLGIWLSAHPMVSLGALGQVAFAWMADTAWNGVVSLAGSFARSGTYAWTVDAISSLPGPQALGIPLLLVAAGCAIPLSAYFLVRLIGSPPLGMTHA
jgi:anti-sigma factor RsiW